MKPNFLVIGAMKSATTSLCDIFAKHPQIFVSNPKELDFFCSDDVFARGLPWYESMFVGGAGRIAVGEGSTGYTKMLRYPLAADRLARCLPEARLIYSVRHPLRRIESHWLHLIAMGESAPPISEALQKWPDMVDTSLYWKQINSYRRYFPDERILVLFLEDFEQRPADIINRCYKFLGVDPEIAFADPAEPSRVSAKMRVHRPLIRALERIPAARAVKKFVPGLTRALTPVLTQALPGRPEWSVDLLREVSKQLADDVAAFLNFYGKPADFWRLE